MKSIACSHGFRRVFVAQVDARASPFYRATVAIAPFEHILGIRRRLPPRPHVGQVDEESLVNASGRFAKTWCCVPYCRLIHSHQQDRLSLDLIVGQKSSIALKAVRIAKESDYGLHANVFGADAARARGIVNRLLCGRAFINEFIVDPAAPFGGFKRSGIGREFGTAGSRVLPRNARHPQSLKRTAEILTAGVKADLPRMPLTVHGLPRMSATCGQ